MNRRVFFRLAGVGSTAVVLAGRLPAAMADLLSQEPGLSATNVSEEDLANGFRNLPESAKPWTYWMWLDGNISREGITADLEAMKRIGLGGVLVMNLGIRSESFTPGAVRFMTPEWREMVHHAMSEAARLGLQMNINNDDGWNSGGPWITPETGMQRLIWTETRVTGPTRFSAQLDVGPVRLDTYASVAVVALPYRAGPEIPTAVSRTVQKEPERWLQVDMGRAVSPRSLTLSNPALKRDYVGPSYCELLVSDDGQSFRPVRRIETGWLSFTAPRSASFRLENVSGRYFRLLLPDTVMDPEHIVLTLGNEPCVDHWHMKAGHSYIREHGGGSPLYALPIELPIGSDGEFPAAADVIDLTRHLQADGSLRWDAPAGEWIVLRLGHTPTGMKNGFATPEGSGLDSDKLNREALELHLSGMVDKLIGDAGPLVGSSWTMLHTDSWESGAANWTATFPEEFKRRRDYDLTCWLPVMAGGRIVGSIEQSERFLWDVRRTLADVFVDNHLKHFRELAHQRGLPFSSESAGRQQFLYDPINFLATADLPMGEFWNTPQEKRPRPDCKAAASTAHLLNLPIAGAEAFTQNQNNAGRWLESPYTLKALGDEAFCCGINRLFFHRTVLQPDPKQKPGLSWPDVGINFDSTQTWWEEAAGWMEYLTRSQYLLQQGRFVADVALLTDEGAPSSLVRHDNVPIGPDDHYDTSTVTESVLRRYCQMPYLPPLGYDYDYVNVDAVEQMEVRQGRLTLPHGMSYRLLVLPVGERMTLRLARKLRELVHAGATVVGDRPKRSPTLSDYPRGDAELQEIARDLWGEEDSRSTARSVGKGQVFRGNATQQALEAMQVVPDFEAAPLPGPGPGAGRIDFIHRQTDGADIYFVSNQRYEPVRVNAAFRVTDRQPEIWLPDTGAIFDCTVFREDSGRTIVPLELDPAGSLFVVFRSGIRQAPRPAGSNFPPRKTVATIDGGWTVHFGPLWDRPAEVRLETLQSWTEFPDPGLRHYSGKATYRKEIEIDRGHVAAGRRLYLELGTVKEIARVRLNGHDLGVLWKAPFRLDITNAARAGANVLEIDVTNLWPNRLIGDAALPEQQRLTKGNWNPYTPESPLLESGLLGPVTLER